MNPPQARIHKRQGGGNLNEQSDKDRLPFLNGHTIGGALVAAAALVAWTASRGLEFGSLAEIGPGLFPLALAVLLLALSLVLFGIGVLQGSGEDLVVPGREALRAIVGIVVALVIFSLTIRGTGFIPALGVTGATPLAILIAGIASRETRWLDLVVFAIVLTAFCTVLFRFLLGLPLPLAPWLLGY
jgi:putative tricarboxylic transport membrane protein